MEVLNDVLEDVTREEATDVDLNPKEEVVIDGDNQSATSVLDNTVVHF